MSDSGEVPVARTMFFGGSLDGNEIDLQPISRYVDFPVFLGSRVIGSHVYRHRRVVEVRDGRVVGWNVYAYEGEHLPTAEEAAARLKAAGIRPHFEEPL